MYIYDCLCILVSMKEKYYTVEEFAEILRVTPQTIRKFIREGRINAIKLTNKGRSPYRICETEFIRLSMVGYEENMKIIKENLKD